MKITLDLTPEEGRALLELTQEYLDKGPAWECMQMWDDPHEPETLNALLGKITTAMEKTQ